MIVMLYTKVNDAVICFRLKKDNIKTISWPSGSTWSHLTHSQIRPCYQTTGNLIVMITRLSISFVLMWSGQLTDCILLYHSSTIMKWKVKWLSLPPSSVHSSTSVALVLSSDPHDVRCDGQCHLFNSLSWLQTISRTQGKCRKGNK